MNDSDQYRHEIKELNRRMDAHAAELGITPDKYRAHCIRAMLDNKVWQAAHLDGTLARLFPSIYDKITGQQQTERQLCTDLEPSKS